MTTIDQKTVLNEALKVNFEGPLFNTVVLRSETFDLFKQTAKTMTGPEGRYIELAHMFGAPEGVGSRDEHGFLPVPETPAFVNGRVRLKKTVGTIQTTWNAMVNAVKGKAAFADWAEMTLMKLVETLTDDLDRQAIGYGTGIICRVDESSPDTSLQIDAPFGFAGDEKGWLPGLRRGQRIVFSGNADGSGLRDGGKSAKILSMDPDGNSEGGILTLDALPAGVADNDYIFKGDDYGSNAPNQGSEVEMMGLTGMIDDGTVLDTFQNISRTTYPEWKSRLIDASASPYSGSALEVLFMRLADDAALYGKGDITHLLCSRNVFRNAFNAIRGLGGYGGVQDPAKGHTGGSKGITYYIGTKPVELRAVLKIPVGMLYAIDRATMLRFSHTNGEWDNTTGSIFRQVSNGAAVKDEFFAYYRCYMELACTDPRKNARATGVSETAV